MTSTDETFEFILSAEDDDTPMPEDLNGHDIFIDGSGEGNFGIIYYDTPGVYHYQVSEVTGCNNHYTYDQTVYEIVVYVYLSNDELCTMVCVYEEDSTEKAEAIIFENIYSDPDEESSSSTTTTTTTTVVDTSDINGIRLAVGLMVVSMLGIVVIAFYKNMSR
ncbi:MAG: FctA domain-containing protein [Erysipelotrichaceae bacterium]